jgi:DNA-binding MarR family transcriptional regulator
MADHPALTADRDRSLDAPVPDPADLGARLRGILMRGPRRLRREERTGLTPTEDSALRTVMKYGPLVPSELAERERISRPSATRVLRSLKDKGLVAVIPNPADARSYWVVLSPGGSELREARRARRQEYLESLLDGLTEDQLRRLEAALPVLEAMFELDD